jgi:hypothetical protein
MNLYLSMVNFRGTISLQVVDFQTSTMNKINHQKLKHIGVENKYYLIFFYNHTYKHICY